MSRASSSCGRLLAGSAVTMAVIAAVSMVSPLLPTANAEYFVSCHFSTARPFIYQIDGAQYIGSRVDVSNCETNVGSTALTFQMVLTASGAPPGAMGPGQSNLYTETRDVHTGDSFSVAFPNDDRLVPAYPGVLGAKVNVLSILPGYVDPRFLDYQCSAWQFAGVTCPSAVVT